MGKGQDKIAISLMDLQPTAIVEFFLLYFNTIDRPDSFIAFHGGSNFNKGIVWQGVTYLPVPVETEGFEINANGQMPRPKIRISNKDYFMTDMLIRNSDFQYSEVVRKRTFIKYLDDINFDGGNPWGEADASAEISNESYIISQKIVENKNFVEFELTSPLDLDNFELNNRLILSRYCCWTYRGNGCNYLGRAIETEEGETLFPRVITVQDTNQQWSPSTHYIVNDSVYLENKRIILDSDSIIQPGSTTPVFAKIWFVCKKEHTASEQSRPDDNSEFWLKDGCTKKLSACKKRFSLTSTRLVRAPNRSITNNYIDFSFKSLNPTNNIAYNFSGISGISTYSGSEFSFLPDASRAVDNVFDSYWLGGDTDASGIIYFNGLPSSNINRINLYDAPGVIDNFGTANFIISGSSVYTPSLVVLPNGSGSYLTPTSPYLGVTGIKISANAGIGSGLRGLTEIDLIDFNLNYGLYNESFVNDGIHLGEGFLIGMWGQFPSEIVNNIKLNLFHFVKTGCQYSGLNLYLEDSQLYCDFAVTSTRNNITTIIPTTIGPMEYPEIFLGEKFCIFIENYQSSGDSTGQFNSRLKIYDINKTVIGEYYPQVENPTELFAGESFLFKNPNKQQGIGPLYLGINQWSDYDRQLVYTSPMRTSTFAIWAEALSENDIRQDIFLANKNADTEKLFPVNYSSTIDNISGDFLENLYTWWDMDMNTEIIIGPNDTAWGAAPYRKLSNVIINQNNPIEYDDPKEYYDVNINPAISGSGFDGSPYLFLTGIYDPKIETQTTETTLQYVIENITPRSSLPFGGFPGTEKYGR